MLRTSSYIPDIPPNVFADDPLWPENRRRIWLLTIRHTGTHYAFEYLKSLRLEQGTIDYRYKKTAHVRGGMYKLSPTYFIHSHIEVNPIIRHVCSDDAIVTLRNPVEVYRSHVYRYTWQNEIFEPYILAAFDLWEKVIDRYGAYIFRVDAKDQRGEVDRLADWIGVDEWKFREISRTTHTSRLDGVLRRPDLFNNVPESIQKLATTLGY